MPVMDHAHMDHSQMDHSGHTGHGGGGGGGMDDMCSMSVRIDAAARLPTDSRSLAVC